MVFIDIITFVSRILENCLGKLFLNPYCVIFSKYFVNKSSPVLSTDKIHQDENGLFLLFSLSKLIKGKNSLINLQLNDRSQNYLRENQLIAFYQLFQAFINCYDTLLVIQTHFVLRQCFLCRYFTERFPTFCPRNTIRFDHKVPYP